MKPTEQIDAPALRELEQEFNVVRELGRGSTATVYLTRHRSMGQLLAIKLVRPHLADSEAAERLARETRTVARLAHPNIVRHYEYRRLRDGAVAIVMQYVAGETLATRLARMPRMDFADVERVLRDVAHALEFAHANAVVHRDIKPHNVLIDGTTGSALVGDFGIAKFIEGDANVTIDGVTVGTPTYMSPEQIDGRSLDGRSDLYSLGLVGWEMLSGSRPWADEPLYSVIYKQKFESLPPVEQLRPDVPARIALAIAGVLHKKRAMRLPSAAEFLRQLSQDEPTASARARPWVAAASLEQDLAADSAAPTVQIPIPSPTAPPESPVSSWPAAPSAAPPPAPPQVAVTTGPATPSLETRVPAPAPAPAQEPARAPLQEAVPTAVPAAVPEPVPVTIRAPERVPAVAGSHPAVPASLPAESPLRARAVPAPLSRLARSERRWRPAVVGAGVFAALLGVASLGAYVTRRAPPERVDTARAAGARLSRPRQAATAATSAPAPTSSATRPHTAAKAAPRAPAAVVTTRPAAPKAPPKATPSRPASIARPPSAAPRSAAAATTAPVTVAAVTPSAPPPTAPPVVVLAARRDLTRTSTVAPGTMLLRVAALRISEGRFTTARSLLDSAITLSPQLGRAYALRARVRLQENQLRDAWSDAEVAGRLGDRWGAEAVTTMVEARARDSVAARARVKRLAAELTSKAALDEDEGVHLAMAMAAVGDEDGAASVLMRIRPVTNSLWTTLKDPVFASLRRSASYPRLMRTLERAAETSRGR